MRQVTQEDVVKNLLSRTDSLEWAVVALMGQQTIDEVNAESTHYQNGVGYNAADAHTMTYYAKYMTMVDYPTMGTEIKRHLSGKYLVDARERIVKYAKQITKLINAELARRDSERSKAKEIANA